MTINLQAKQIIEELLNEGAVIRPPIPVERIAHLCGGQVRYEPFEGQISGILYNENGRIIIGVNSLHPKTRQRFTIAHEIGHIKLHQGEQFYIDRDFRIYLRDEKSSQATDKKEIQANSFAAELLMPEKMLMADWQERDTGYTYDIENDEFIQSLAKRYKVSLQAMIFRLINLRLIQQP